MGRCQCPKEADTLSKTLDDASDKEKAMFLTVLIHGVVEIDSREDLTQDLLMNGYLISTDDNSQHNSLLCTAFTVQQEKNSVQ